MDQTRNRGIESNGALISTNKKCKMCLWWIEYIHLGSVISEPIILFLRYFPTWSARLIKCNLNCWEIYMFIGIFLKIVTPLSSQVGKCWFQRTFQNTWILWLAKSYLKVFGKALTQWWRTCIVPWAAWNAHYHWRATKSIELILKFYLYLTTRMSGFSWLPVQAPAYHGALFWRDAVF